MVKNCNSFAEGNMLSKILPYITALARSQISNLISAFNENEQVSFSHGLNGNKLSEYGNGLVYHLNRITDNQYEYTDDYKIGIKQ